MGGAGELTGHIVVSIACSDPMMGNKDRIVHFRPPARDYSPAFPAASRSRHKEYERRFGY
jgi:hypothetical protein